MIPVAALCLIAFLAYTLWRNSPPYTLKDIRGPPSPSFWLGIEKVFHHALVGDLEFRWVREYGPTWMAKGCLGEEVLWTADPHALQYVFHTSGYKFFKGIVLDKISHLTTGDSMAVQDSVDHQRHRKIMNPAFGAAQLRSFLPAFRRSAARLSQKWKETIQLGEKTDSCIINVENTLSRITLDVFGEVAFDHRFGVFDNNGEDSELAQAFNNLYVDSSLHPPSWDLIFKATWRYLPRSVLSCVKYLPTKEYRHSSTFLQTAIRTGKALISEKAAGKRSGKDIMSILLQSNLSEDTRFRLSDREMHSQIAVLLISGHSTTSLSLTWLLYELSKHPADQRRIRDEIKAARALAEARGDDDLLPSDLNDMSFTNAVIKEGLRFHPIVPTLIREAKEDCIIPLAQPIETKSGKIVQEISILKGQGIRGSVCAYNRLKSVWGEDADEWNPDRFLHSKKEGSSLGVFSNLMTFSAGNRACIGWRFAILEMQALLVELIENFEYRLPEGVEITRLYAGFMIPMVASKIDEGVQMPLQVSLVN